MPSLIDPMLYGSRTAGGGVISSPYQNAQPTRQIDEGITIRMPATANLLIDSLDKTAGATTGDFTISKSQNLFNGLMNRFAIQEVVMSWGIPNVASYWGNNTIKVTIGGTPTTYTIPDGFYTISDLLYTISVGLTSAVGTTTFTISVPTTAAPGPVKLVGTNAFVIVWDSTLNNQLSRMLFASAQLNTTAATSYSIISPLIQGTPYVDIVCNQISVNQSLKDASSSVSSRDVLNRWYFAYDNNVGLADALGFPVSMGYVPFTLRRASPYPKQIKWEANQPIGQVNFQMYDNLGKIVSTANFTGGANLQYQMTLLASED